MYWTGSLMNKVLVNLKNNSYPICIGQGILDDLGRLLPKEELSKKCAVITNPKINKLYGSRVKKSLKSAGFRVISLKTPDRETSKSLKETKKLYAKLLDNQLDRYSCIIALGGGVVGDLTGFVAATYLRGVSLIQVPTTMLAQVDSAIGGKVAIDLPQGKNLVGAFHQPKLVLSDVETLKTLSEKDIRSGLAEVIKYGIISDKEFFKYLEENIKKIKQQDLEILTEIVTKCSKIKAKVVEEDEKELGIRAILNLGHTLGHTLETITNYNKYSHGEAIAIGMVYAAKLSIKLGKLNINEFERIETLIRSIGLPIKIKEDLEVDKFVKIMQLDKKVRAGKIRFILPTKIGEVTITDNVPMNILKMELEKMLE